MAAFFKNKGEVVKKEKDVKTKIADALKARFSKPKE